MSPNALPFEIRARANGTTGAIFSAVRSGEVVALVHHRVGNAKRREEIALSWSQDDRLRDGNPLDPATIARELERVEANVLAVIDEPDDVTPDTGPSEAKEKGPRQAELLVRLALEHYRFGRTPDDEPFAVVVGGPNVAMMFRGSKDALRCNLARLYRQQAGTTPSTNALAEALLVLQGEAMEATPEPVHLRIAKDGQDIIIDIGDASGRVVVVRPGAWDIHDCSPVLFRRTGLTLPLPTPERGGNLELLKSLLNVSRSSWPLLRAWLVAALIPDIAHAIALLTGLQGTGKTVAARLLATLIDPSSAVLRCEPRDLEQWAVSASASIVVAVDNISRISPWWSDALCRAVSGDGMVRRRLYSNDDLAVLVFRRVVLLTSIDPGAMRGDLADRILSIELTRIPDDERRLESEIMERFEAERGRLLGAVLDLLAEVLAVLPTIRLDTMPRLADFGQVLAAIDTVDGVRGRDGSALSLLMRQRNSLAADVVDSDPVGCAIVRFLEGGKEFKGTAGDLLERLTPTEGRPPKDWPENPRAMAARLKRLIPPLRGVGIEVSHNRDRRSYTIQKEAHPTAQTAQTAQNPSDILFRADPECAVGGSVDGCQVPDRAPEPSDSAIKKADSDGVRGVRGSIRTLLTPSEVDVPDGWTAEAWSEACAMANPSDRSDAKPDHDDLSPDERERFENRAAALEVGGVPTDEANRRALASIIRERGAVKC